MASRDPDEQLEAILSESVASARERERNAFDEIAAPFAQSLVLYGAGNLGRNVLRGLRNCGLDAIGFADADPALAGKQIDGLTVSRPEVAARKFGNSAVFVVCVWHPDAHRGVQDIVNTLQQLGARRSLPFPLLFWKYSETFLPHYFWDLPSRILQGNSQIKSAYALYADRTSKSQYLRDLQLRIYAQFPTRPLERLGKQYFPTDLFRISPEECFVDCGAYDGDTIRDLITETGGSFRKAIAFEADPKNFERIQQSLSSAPELRQKVVVREYAVARKTGTLRFAATAGANAAVSSSGDLSVPCVALDEVLEAENPTYIKMDIEGSELDALEGAARIIASKEPLLAICVYHCPDHFWKIPLWIIQAEPDAKLYLRSYSLDGFDSVCYSWPARRSQH